MDFLHLLFQSSHVWCRPCVSFHIVCTSAFVCFCSLKVCTSMRSGLCQEASGDVLHLLFQRLCIMLRFWNKSGVKLCKFRDVFYFIWVLNFNLCPQVLLLVRSLCQHASGVMPIGARGFLTHFILTFMPYRPISGPSFVNSVTRLV